MARSLGSLYLAGATIGLVSLFLPRAPGTDVGALGVNIALAYAGGLLALLVGLYVQMVSSNRNQRVLIVAGIIAGFVGLAIGVSRGGFIG